MADYDFDCTTDLRNKALMGALLDRLSGRSIQAEDILKYVEEVQLTPLIPVELNSTALNELVIHDGNRPDSECVRDTAESEDLADVALNSKIDQVINWITVGEIVYSIVRGEYSLKL